MGLGMIRLTLDQGSQEWLTWRRYGIGSSDAPVILNGTHFERDRYDLWREKRGEQEPRVPTPFINMRMKRGQVLEEDVRNWYQRLVGKTVKPVVGYHPTREYLKASLDGFEPTSQTILEIKCPGKKDHESALCGEVPSKYIPQLIHQCLVTGTNRVHYLSFNPIYPKPERYALVRYRADPQEMHQLLIWEEVFWGCVLTGLPPHEEYFRNPPSTFNAQDSP